MDIFPLIADRIRSDPSVLDEAIDVLDRWDARQVGPASRRREWRNLLVAAKAGGQGMKELLGILDDTGEEARRLKDFAPFAGILSREERRKAFLQCAYDH